MKFLFVVVPKGERMVIRLYIWKIKTKEKWINFNWSRI